MLNTKVGDPRLRIVVKVAVVVDGEQVVARVFRLHKLEKLVPDRGVPIYFKEPREPSTSTEKKSWNGRAHTGNSKLNTGIEMTEVVSALCAVCALRSFLYKNPKLHLAPYSAGELSPSSPQPGSE